MAKSSLTHARWRIDDVLTSGKHYKCCERKLREHRPQASIIGVFLMRRAPARARRSLGRAW
jgi:predicted amidophosphoribosyltransferase